MPRIAGVDIPNDKRIDIALTYIYGVGRQTAVKIISQTSVNPRTKSKDLTSTEIQDILKVISTLPVEGDLRKIIRGNIEMLKRSGSYRGLRHMMKLPSRGQRTRSNARTLKGAKKTVGSLTKDDRQKTETTTTPEAKK